MAFGSILGGVDERRRHRPALLVSLVSTAAGMNLAPSASNPVQLSPWRVVTGLGIGGMLSCTNAFLKTNTCAPVTENIHSAIRSP